MRYKKEFNSRRLAFVGWPMRDFCEGQLPFVALKALTRGSQLTLHISSQKNSPHITCQSRRRRRARHAQHCPCSLSQHEFPTIPSTTSAPSRRCTISFGIRTWTDRPPAHRRELVNSHAAVNATKIGPCSTCILAFDPPCRCAVSVCE